MTFTFRDLFGDSDECRIMEAFAENPDDVLSATDLMRIVDVESRAVVYQHVTKLIYNNIVILQGREGNIEMYKLNTDNKISKILILLESTMSSAWLCWLLEECD